MYSTRTHPTTPLHKRNQHETDAHPHTVRLLWIPGPNQTISREKLTSRVLAHCSGSEVSRDKEMPRQLHPCPSHRSPPLLTLLLEVLLIRRSELWPANRSHSPTSVIQASQSANPADSVERRAQTNRSQKLVPYLSTSNLETDWYGHSRHRGQSGQQRRLPRRCRVDSHMSTESPEQGC